MSNQHVVGCQCVKCLCTATGTGANSKSGRFGGVFRKIVGGHQDYPKECVIREKEINQLLNRIDPDGDYHQLVHEFVDTITNGHIGLHMHMQSGYSYEQWKEITNGHTARLQTHYHQTVGFARQLFVGLDWLHHRARVLHLDIKLDNVVISSPQANLKIIDFGSAHPIALNTDYVRIKYETGTPGECAPEQFQFNLQSFKIKSSADVFAGSIVAIQLVSRTNLEMTNNDWEAFMAGEISYCEMDCVRQYKPLLVDGFWNMLKASTRTDPEKRPSIADILRKEYMMGANCLIHSNKPSTLPVPKVYAKGAKSAAAAAAASSVPDPDATFEIPNPVDVVERGLF